MSVTTYVYIISTYAQNKSVLFWRIADWILGSQHGL